MVRPAEILVLVAQPWDVAVPALSAAWPGVTRVVSPRDLSRPGWRLRSEAGRGARLVAGGEPIDVADVAGLITRIGWIQACDLPWIDPGDREFVAAEMGAFLLGFLHHAECPVLNRPTPACLAGPMFHPLAWRARARAARFALADPGADPVRWLTVIGGRTRTDHFRPEAWGSERLANQCGARLLSVGVTADGAFADAHPFPDLTDPVLARAAVQPFQIRVAA